MVTDPHICLKQEINSLAAASENLKTETFDIKKKINSNSRLFTCNVIKTSYNKKIYTEFSIISRGAKATAIGLIDTGADVSVISKTYIRQLFPHNYKDLFSRIRKIDCSVSGFGNSKIAIEGSLNLPLQFHNRDAIQSFQFLVLADTVKTNISCLLGVKILTQFGLSVNISKKEGKNIPYVTKRIGNKFLYIKSAYISDFEMFKCISNKVSLTAGEVSFIKVYLNSFTSFTTDSEVIISAPLDNCDNMEGLKIQTIKSSVYADKMGNKYSFCSVVNDSKKIFEGKIHCLVENFDDFELKPINHKTVKEMQSRNLNILCEVDTGGDIIDYEYEICSSQNNSLGSHTTPAQINLMKFNNFGADIGCDPNAINNNTPNLNTSLSDSRCPIPVSKDIPTEIEKLMNDKSRTVNLGMQELDGQEIESTLEKTRGYTLPKHINAKPEDMIDLTKFREEIRPNVKEIFINKYPNTIPLFSLDVGSISQFLGKYRLKLQDNAQLPKQRKIFYQSPAESSHMKTILDFMCHLNIISPATTTGDGEKHQYSSPAFLISKKDLEASGRLIVDYSGLNSQIHTQPISLPNLDQIIGQLKGKAFYSNIDISNAFNSIELTEDSKKLTLFSTCAGNYIFSKLATGLCSSPEILNRFMAKMIHYILVRDEKGQIIWLPDGTAKLEHAPLAHVYLYYDDILIATDWVNNYETSKEIHFKLVEEVVRRLSTHNAKVSINKCTFYASSIKFLGWSICRNYIRVDPSRIEKILAFKLPQGAKNWRQFLGTVNSIRLVLGHSVLQYVNELTILTSDKHKEPITKKQEEAFNNILKSLTRAPLFANLIDPNAKKILFTDASASKSGSFSALLCQLVPPTNRKEAIPNYIIPEDYCHKIIHKNQLQCIPIDYIREGESRKDFLLRNHVDNPPISDYLTSENMTLDDTDQKYSLSKSLQTSIIINDMKLTLKDLGLRCLNELKKGIMKLQIRDFIFKGDKDCLKKFEIDLLAGHFICDSTLYILTLVAKALQRPITVISSFKLDNGKYLKTLNHDKTKNPFFILLYKLKETNKIVCRVAYINRTFEYDLTRHRGSIEFIAWMSKPIPKSLSTRHILDLENYGILLALHTFRKYIAKSNDLLLCTDSKPLFYLFSSPVQESSVKLSRWNAKLLDGYPLMKLAFVTSKRNFSDILTRHLNIRQPNPNLFQTPRSVSTNLENFIPDTVFSLESWSKFVNSNPQLLTYDEKEHIKYSSLKQKKDAELVNNINILTSSKIAKIHLEQSIKNLTNYITEPLNVLETYITTNEIVTQQRLEYASIYDKLRTSENNVTTIDRVDYKLMDRVIFRYHNDHWKILLPKALLKYLVVFVHLRCGHSSAKQMMLNVDNYYCKGLSTYVEKFTKYCLPCFYNNKSTHHLKLGMTPSPDTPFEGVYIDYLEALTPGKELKKDDKIYKHILIISDIHSGTIQLHPVVSKSMSEFMHCFRHSIWQVFRPAFIVADNALTWNNETIIKDLAINCKVSLVQTSALHPQARGHIESQAKIVKNSLKKYLALANNYSWVALLPTLSQLLNTTKQSRTTKAPFEILFGEGTRLANGLWDTLKAKPKIHPTAYKFEQVIEQQSNNKLKIYKEAQGIVNEGKKDRNKEINKKRGTGNFKKGQIVFVLDKTLSKLKLAPTYQKSPYIVVEVLYTSAYVFRLTDGFVADYSLEFLKKFEPRDHIYNDMPENIKNILQKDISDYENVDLIDLMNFDDYELPKYAFAKGAYFDDSEPSDSDFSDSDFSDSD